MDSAVSSLPSIDLLIRKLRSLETQQRRIEDVLPRQEEEEKSDATIGFGAVSHE